MKVLNKNSTLLLITNSINNIVSLFVNTFLVSYLLCSVVANIKYVAIFYLIDYAVLAVSFYFLGYVIKKYDKSITYKIGIILRGLFILSICLLKSNLQNYVVLIGLLGGLAEGVYYVAYNSMKSEMISSKISQKYTAIAQIVEKIICIIVPIIMGSVFEFSSFSNIAFIVFILCIIQIVVSSFIKNENVSVGVYSVKVFCKTMNENIENKKVLKSLQRCYFFYGLTGGASSLITLLILLKFDSNLSLGIFTSIFSVVGICCLLFYSKFYSASKLRWLLIVCSFVPLIGMVGLLISVNKTTILLYNLTYILSTVIPIAILDTRRTSLIRQMTLHKYIVENQALCEVNINLGREVSFIVLLIGGIIASEVVVLVLVCIMVLTMVLFGLSTYRLETKVQVMNDNYETKKQLESSVEDKANTNDIV